MAAMLSAPVRRAGAKATLQFDWLVPGKPLLRVSEVAHALGMKSTFVEEFFAEKCHRYGEGAEARGERVRPPMRIPRAFVIAELVASARYSAEEKVQAVSSTFREFNRDELIDLQRVLAEQLRRLS